MIDDLPLPVGPTRAVFFPASNERLIFLRTISFSLDGYENSTSLNYISPFKCSSLMPVFRSIFGFLSMILIA